MRRWRVTHRTIASMGHTLWIEDRGRPGSETHDDMGVLLRLQKPLDALAAKLGVAKLSSFYDYSELERAYDGVNEPICTPEWFDSTSGLRSVTRLRSTLENDFGALEWKPDTGEAHWPASLLDDLRSCEVVLKEAVANGREFRLLVVP